MTKPPAGGARQRPPDQLEPLPLRRFAERLPVNRARVLIHGGEDGLGGLGPVGGQFGAEDLEVVLRTATQPDA